MMLEGSLSVEEELLMYVIILQLQPSHDLLKSIVATQYSPQNSHITICTLHRLPQNSRQIPLNSHSTHGTHHRIPQHTWNIPQSRGTQYTLQVKVHTMEQPGVKAPGTANMSTLPAEHRVPVLTALAGVSSNKFTEGSASPI